MVSLDVEIPLALLFNCAHTAPVILVTMERGLSTFASYRSRLPRSSPDTSESDPCSQSVGSRHP
jgi:hypothetical protein